MSMGRIKSSGGYFCICFNDYPSGDSGGYSEKFKGVIRGIEKNNSEYDMGKI